MIRAACVQLTETTDRQIRELAQRWELPSEKHLSQVIRRAVEESYRKEFERRKKRT